MLIAASGAAAAGVAATDQREGDRGAATATAAGETAGIQQAAAAAAAPNAHGSRMLEQKLSCTLVAALSYVQASAAPQGSAEAAMHLLHLLQRD